jgi:hypothetical protein
MNPLTDKLTEILKPDGSVLRIIQPGALVKPSANWRMTREAYERYAPYLEMAVNNWPKETKFSIPDDISPNTFCARFRDARKALLLFHYDLELESKLRALADAPVISMDPDGRHVWFRERGVQSAPTKVVKGETMNRLSTELRPTTALPDMIGLTSLCNLMKAGVVRGPFAFTGIITSAAQETIESQFDVSFVIDNEKSTTTLI